MTGTQLAAALATDEQTINYQLAVLKEYGGVGIALSTPERGTVRNTWRSLIEADELIKTQLALSAVEDAEELQERTDQRAAA
jgi:hypothetical protein